LTWFDFFDVFVGKLIEVEHNEDEERLVSNVHNVPNTPTRLTHFEEQVTNNETTVQTNIGTSQAQSELDTLCTLDTNLSSISEKTNSSDLAPKRELDSVSVQHAQPTVLYYSFSPPDSAESCLANPICANRLKLCLWKRLKVPKEEKKAALYAEIERRGPLFERCLKDALEYAKRESEP
jgi:hypothetical protein